MSRAPIAAAWALSACMALALAGSVYQIPIQVSDSLEVIVRNFESPSVRSVFVGGLHNSHTMLRPLREVQTRLLVNAGRALGSYHLAFRGYHAITAVLLVALFTYLARPRTWPDVAALAFALTVLTGMSTFQGLAREAYPVNHFLLIAIYGLAMMAIGSSRGGWLADAAAVVVFVLAALTLESGLLLLPIAVMAYVAGVRGISRWGLGCLAVVAVSYFVLRSEYLGMQSAEVGDRMSGFGAGELTAADQLKQFGGNPVPYYVYNVVMAPLTVLLSQPVAGQWTVADAWRQGDVMPVFWVKILSSAATTALIGWFLWTRGESGRRRWRDPVPLVFLAVLAGNAVISFPYAKDEIISLAGVFYALVAGGAMAELLGRTRIRAAPVAIAVAFAAVSAAWAWQSAGLHFKLRYGAFNARNEWANVVASNPNQAWARNAETRRMVSDLKQEAVLRRTVSVRGQSARYERWWGEE